MLSLKRDPSQVRLRLRDAPDASFVRLEYQVEPSAGAGVFGAFDTTVNIMSPRTPFAAKVASSLLNPCFISTVNCDYSTMKVVCFCSRGRPS